MEALRQSLLISTTWETFEISMVMVEYLSLILHICDILSFPDTHSRGEKRYLPKLSQDSRQPTILRLSWSIKYSKHAWEILH